MAELLVIKRQSVNRAMFPGDVVCVMPDGWRWGKAERGPEAQPLWTVIEVPGAPVSAFAEFLQPLIVNGQLALYRRVHLNLLALGERPTFEQVMAARLEKVAHPLLS